MTGNQIRRRTPSRIKNSDHLIAITIRMNTNDRDHFEHSARLQGISLSECLRNVIEDSRKMADKHNEMIELEYKLKLIIDDISSSRRDQNDFMDNLDKKIESITDQFSDTSRIIKNSNDMIQSNFEQLFQAFFKLQAYIEHVFSAIGNRK